MPLRLLNGATATNTPPSAATDGVPLRGQTPGLASAEWHGEDEGLLSVRSTAGSATMTVTIRLWGYVEFFLGGSSIAYWVPLGTGATDAVRGVINQGVAIGEQASLADALRHSEIVTGLSAFSRLAAEVVAIGGTSTAVDCFLTSIEAG